MDSPRTILKKMTTVLLEIRKECPSDVFKVVIVAVMSSCPWSSLSREERGHWQRENWAKVLKHGDGKWPKKEVWGKIERWPQSLGLVRVKEGGRRGLMMSAVRRGCQRSRKSIKRGQQKWGLPCVDPGGMMSGGLQSFTYAPLNRGFKSAWNTNTQ